MTAILLAILIGTPIAAVLFAFALVAKGRDTWTVAFLKLIGRR